MINFDDESTTASPAPPPQPRPQPAKEKKSSPARTLLPPPAQEPALANEYPSWDGEDMILDEDGSRLPLAEMYTQPQIPSRADGQRPCPTRSVPSSTCATTALANFDRGNSNEEEQGKGTQSWLVKFNADPAQHTPRLRPTPSVARPRPPVRASVWKPAQPAATAAAHRVQKPATASGCARLASRAVGRVKLASSPAPSSTPEAVLQDDEEENLPTLLLERARNAAARALEPFVVDQPRPKPHLHTSPSRYTPTAPQPNNGPSTAQVQQQDDPSIETQILPSQARAQADTPNQAHAQTKKQVPPRARHCSTGVSFRNGGYGGGVPCTHERTRRKVLGRGPGCQNEFCTTVE